MQPSAIVITTNGFVKRAGDAVMGRGCAKIAADADPRLPLRLGKSIKAHGNNVSDLGMFGPCHLVSFPVKPSSAQCMQDRSNVVQHMKHRMTPGQMVPGWACVASIEIIARSAHQLVKLTEEAGWAWVVLPRPGCGAGELDWNTVKPILDDILDNTFYSITFGGNRR
jgi:hypothetical protein